MHLRVVGEKEHINNWSACPAEMRACVYMRHLCSSPSRCTPVLVGKRVLWVVREYSCGWVRSIVSIGVYHRMEDANPTERFKNGMRLTIAGTVACLDIPRRKKNKRKVELVVQSIDSTQFRMDWGPAAPEWGVATFRICDEQGARGLKEGDTKFWKKQDSDVLLPTTPPAGGVQEPALTWSPSGKSTAWLQPPPDSPPWPTRLGIQLDGTPSEDATGSAGFASMGGEPTDAASSEQQPPRQRRRW